MRIAARIKPQAHSMFSTGDPMALAKIILALHLDQTRGGAAESFGAVAFGIKKMRRCLGGADQLYALVVKRVDQKHETARGVAPGRRQRRDMVDQDGMKVARDLQIVGRSQRLFAQIREGKT